MIALIKKLIAWKWSFVNGHKTQIGLAGLFCVYGAEGMGWIPPEVAVWAERYFLAVAGLGIGHKLGKAGK